jgi:hypothetical protein
VRLKDILASLALFYQTRVDEEALEYVESLQQKTVEDGVGDTILLCHFTGRIQV